MDGRRELFLQWKKAQPCVLGWWWWWEGGGSVIWPLVPSGKPRVTKGIFFNTLGGSSVLARPSATEGEREAGVARVAPTRDITTRYRAPSRLTPATFSALRSYVCFYFLLFSPSCSVTANGSSVHLFLSRSHSLFLPPSFSPSVVPGFLFALLLARVCHSSSLTGDLPVQEGCTEKKQPVAFPKR